MEKPLQQPTTTAPRLSTPVFWILFAVIVLGGIAIRMADTASWRRVGPDEYMYRRYVYLMDGGEQRFSVFNRNQTMRAEAMKVDGTGAMAMPSLCAAYLRTQQPEETMCELPPTRFLYIYISWIWKNVRSGDMPPIPTSELNKSSGTDDYSKDGTRRDPGLAALNDVSCTFSVLLMVAGGLFAWRMLGRAAGLGVLALMACDPLQLHLSQHAMIDGFFAFWALMCLWTTWECLRAPRSIGWLSAHIVCLALMVMTKENAFFAYCAIAVVIVANRWLKFGTATPRFLIASVAGPALGVLALVLMAGGPGNFFAIYKNLVTKAQTLDYAQLSGDGPWHRYLLDMMILSPIVLCLALGAVFALGASFPLGGRRNELAYLVIFVVVSYAIMCNVRYGMNLRYTSIWGMPLRAAAFLLVADLCARFGQRQWLVVALITVGMCAYERGQYATMVDSKVGNKDVAFYETLPEDMLRRLEVIKDKSDLQKPGAAPASPQANTPQAASGAALSRPSTTERRAHPVIDDAWSYALEAAQAYVKDFTINEDHWGGEMAVGKSHAVVVTLFKGKEYVFCAGAEVKEAELMIHVYDSKGDLAETDAKITGHISTTKAVPAKSGQYYVVISLEKSPKETTKWGMVYGVK